MQTREGAVHIAAIATAPRMQTREEAVRALFVSEPAAVAAGQDRFGENWRPEYAPLDELVELEESLADRGIVLYLARW